DRRFEGSPGRRPGRTAQFLDLGLDRCEVAHRHPFAEYAHVLADGREPLVALGLYGTKSFETLLLFSADGLETAQRLGLDDMVRAQRIAPPREAVGSSGPIVQSSLLRREETGMSVDPLLMNSYLLGPGLAGLSLVLEEPFMCGESLPDLDCNVLEGADSCVKIRPPGL